MAISSLENLNEHYLSQNEFSLYCFLLFIQVSGADFAVDFIC